MSLYAALRTRLAPRRRVGFLCSWTFLVLPLLLSMTLFANAPHYLVTFLLLPTLLLLRLRKPDGGTPLPSSQPNTSSAFELGQRLYQSTSTNVVADNSTFAPLPALTTYRTHMMLMTVLAILAVDFPVFPRSLVKCETYGVSLVCFPSWTLDSFVLLFCIDGFGCWIFCFFSGHCFRYTFGQRSTLYSSIVPAQAF